MCPILLSCWKCVLPYCPIGNVPPFLLLEMCPTLLYHCKNVLHFIVPLEMCPISLSHWKCALFYCPVRNVPPLYCPVGNVPPVYCPSENVFHFIENVPHLVSWWKCAPLFCPAGNVIHLIFVPLKVCPISLPRRKCAPFYCPAGNVPRGKFRWLPAFGQISWGLRFRRTQHEHLAGIKGCCR